MVQYLIQHLSMRNILDFAEIIMLGYALYRFTRKPQDSLEERVSALEERMEKAETEADLRQKEIEQQLRQGNDKFRSIGNFLEVLLTCTLALINWEVHYCESEHKDISSDLEDARKTLNKCLSKFNKEDDV